MAEAEALRARDRFENMEDRVQAEGARGEVRVTGKVPPPAPWNEELVGYKHHHQELYRAAYPERASAEAKLEAEKQRQRAMADDFFSDFGDSGVVIEN